MDIRKKNWSPFVIVFLVFTILIIPTFFSFEFSTFRGSKSVSGDRSFNSPGAQITISATEVVLKNDDIEVHFDLDHSCISNIYRAALGQNIIVHGSGDVRYWSGFQEYVKYIYNPIAYYDSDGAQYEILLDTASCVKVRFYDIEPRHHYSGTTAPVVFNWTITVYDGDDGFWLDRAFEATTSTTSLEWEMLQAAFLDSYNCWYFNATPTGHGLFESQGVTKILADPEPDQIVSLYSTNPTLGNITFYPADASLFDEYRVTYSSYGYSRIQPRIYYTSISPGIYDLGSLRIGFTSLTWDEPPTDQSITLGESFRYDLNASSTTDIDQWWLNNTAQFTIDSNGVISNLISLAAGSYGLQVWVNDTFNNVLTAIFTLTVLEDTTTPTTTTTTSTGTEEISRYALKIGIMASLTTMISALIGIFVKKEITENKYVRIIVIVVGLIAILSIWYLIWIYL